MNMMKGLLGSLNQDGSAAGGGQANDELFKQFSAFLQDTENDESMKGVLDSVVKDIISKDSLYEPMKTLRDAYPEWLEKNWESQTPEDLERYNLQLDKITEVCMLFEKEESKENKVSSDVIFEHLGKLQELGHPPEELMKKV